MKIAPSNRPLVPCLALVLAAMLGAIVGSFVTATLLRGEYEGMLARLSDPR
jgi:hypothetical protein